MQWPGAAGKLLELSRDVVPSLRRLALMVNVGFPDAVLDASEAQAAAQSLGLEIATLEIRRAGDIVPAFESLKDHADALYVTADALLNANRIRINTLALGARLPTMYEFRESVEAGGLISYDQIWQVCSGAPPSWPTRFCAGAQSRSLVSRHTLGITRYLYGGLQAKTTPPPNPTHP